MKNNRRPRSTSAKPVAIGLYGVPGAGKTTLLRQLKGELGEDHFLWCEGSERLAKLIEGGLDAFKASSEAMKESLRKACIKQIGREGEEQRRVVWTDADADTFTHIFYLDSPPSVILNRHADDNGHNRRIRSAITEIELQEWQDREKISLQTVCADKNIVFEVVSGLYPFEAILNPITYYVNDAIFNISRALVELDHRMANMVNNCQLQKMFVFDANKTLAAQDTGNMFWEKRGRRNRLKEVFSESRGYSYDSFRKVCDIYDDECDVEDYEKSCKDVAKEVVIHPELMAFLDHVKDEAHVGAVVLTAGLGSIWKEAIATYDLSRAAFVIGNGQSSNGFVVTPEVKRAIIARLQQRHQTFVYAFGDSEVDVPMLKQADEAIVVVHESKESDSIDTVLNNAIKTGELQAKQLVLGSNTRQRLDSQKLPFISLAKLDTREDMLAHRPLQVTHFTGTSAERLLTTATRNSKIKGLDLREAHRKIGYYLALHCLGDLLGLAAFDIPHVQAGKSTTGHKLAEEEIVIVPLMLGGEPMALGVAELFPNALFVHAKKPDELQGKHLFGIKTVILVDSVVNDGTSVAEFAMQIDRIVSGVHIVVVANVVQALCANSDGPLARALPPRSKVSLVALRLSTNKYKGSGGTDTGARLFNTTEMETIENQRKKVSQQVQ
ncbi:hypothetical protein LTR78_004611 [Recurvomyces mirabilis]|uniref:AAA+ ATPase domain-containing protein n=1 Tax=Recurvomyces mirabilis TaxID=574656 RepID=A0AAE0WPK4_9PEZI|nr:hypothetical protein LTR78_004611 [Recurvomyces mirabilis]KAK5152894.1 hypothetical protein LTS14_008002 [Recurvomyces mirabilis]